MHNLKCSITGQAQNRFPFGFDEEDYRCINLKIKILQQIGILYDQYDARTFISDCSLGVSMWSAEIVAGLMPLHPDIELFCIMPYEEQATKWPNEYRNRFFDLHENCTETVLINTAFTTTCLLECSEYLISECDMLLAVCDNSDFGNVIRRINRYATQKNLSVININPVTLAVNPTIFAV